MTRSQCQCAIGQLKPGTVVVVSNEEHMGLFVYAGESEHSSGHRHMLKLLRYDQALASWHMHCGAVYLPHAGTAWPYTEYVDPEAHLAGPR